MTTPTIAVKESLDDLKGIGPSTGISGFKLVYVIGKGLYQYKTGDQSSNVPSGNDGDAWVAPSEDTSGKSGAWQLDGSGILDPEHATDSGTDSFVSATNTSVPGDGVTITRDFQSANNTTTPTLDGKTMTTRDGSALWAGAVSGPHELQYASGTDTYLVLEPILAQEQPLVFPGTSTDPALALDTWRTPNANRPTKVLIGLQSHTNGTTNGEIFVEIDLSGGTTPDFRAIHVISHDNLPSGSVVYGYTEATVPAGASYQINNFSDPNSANGILHHQEFPL